MADSKLAALTFKANQVCVGTSAPREVNAEHANYESDNQTSIQKDNNTRVLFCQEQEIITHPPTHTNPTQP